MYSGEANDVKSGPWDACDAQQYPQPTAPPPYFQPPMVGYPAPPGYGSPYPVAAPPAQSAPQQQQQQHQSVVVVNNQQQAIATSSNQSFCCHMVFACFVCWCSCNVLFGFIAFILAVAASGESSPANARRLGQASLAMSVCGIIVSCLAVAFVFGTGTLSFSTCSGHTYLGTCYKYKLYVGLYGYCSGHESLSYCYTNDDSCPFYYYANVCYRNQKRITSVIDFCVGVKSTDGYCYY